MSRTSCLTSGALPFAAAVAVAVAAAQLSPAAGQLPTHSSKAWDERRPLTDINTAPKEQLTLLRGIGPKGAAAIIKGRPYGSSAELLDRGILNAEIYDVIKDRIVARRSP
jgi:DNA uptake protein ComE-like DNA-binding protein